MTEPKSRIDKPIREHLAKIDQTERLLSDPDISRKRRNDLTRYLNRLNKELKAYRRLYHGQ